MVVVYVIDFTCADLVSTDIVYLSAAAGVGGVVVGHWVIRWEVDEEKGSSRIICILYMGCSVKLPVDQQQSASILQNGFGFRDDMINQINMALGFLRKKAVH